MKKTKQSYIDRWKELKADDVEIIAAIFQEAHAAQLTIDGNLISEIFGTDAFSYSAEARALIQSPPSAVSGRIPFTDDLDDHPVEFYKNLALWSAKDEALPGKPPLLTESQKAKLAIALGDHLFIRAGTEWGVAKSSPRTFLVDQDREEDNLVADCFGTPSEIGLYIAKQFAEEMDRNDLILSASSVKSMVSEWEVHHKTADDLVKATNNDLLPLYRGHPTLHYSKYVPEEGDCPTIREFLGRCSEGEALAALMWGVYTECYHGRQVVWIHGAEGGEGKSTTVHPLLTELFGERGFKAVDNKTSSGDFSLESIIGAKMVFHPDCNNTKFALTETIKKLSGGGRDKITVNAKYMTQYQSNLDIRMIVCSNYAPYLLNDHHSMDRIIYSTIEPFKGRVIPPRDLEKLILSEIPAFLTYARDCFLELTDNGKNEAISLKSETITIMKSLVGNSDIPFTTFLGENFEITDDPDDWVPIRSISDLGAADELIKHYGRKSFAEWLIDVHCLKKVKKSQGGKIVEAITNLKLRGL